MKFLFFFNLNPFRLFGNSGLAFGLLFVFITTLASAIYGYIKKDYSYFKICLKTDLIIVAVILLVLVFHLFS